MGTPCQQQTTPGKVGVNRVLKNGKKYTVEALIVPIVWCRKVFNSETNLFCSHDRWCVDSTGGCSTVLTELYLKTGKLREEVGVETEVGVLGFVLIPTTGYLVYLSLLSSIALSRSGSSCNICELSAH